jgi:ribosomal protein S18 acetylase RimI-like enzyme
VGFIAVRERDQAGEIVLIGVDATSRGRGLGHRLVDAAASWFHSRSLGRAMVVTQGRNRSALSLYQGHGYRVSALELWYHRWF